MKRNANTSLVAYEGETLAGAILCGHDGRNFLDFYRQAITERGNLPLFERKI